MNIKYIEKKNEEIKEGTKKNSELKKNKFIS